MTLNLISKKSLLILGAIILLLSCKGNNEATEKPVQQDLKESRAYDLEIEKSNYTESNKDIAVLLFEDGFDCCPAHILLLN